MDLCNCSCLKQSYTSVRASSKIGTTSPCYFCLEASPQYDRATYFPMTRVVPRPIQPYITEKEYKQLLCELNGAIEADYDAAQRTKWLTRIIPCLPLIYSPQSPVAVVARWQSRLNCVVEYKEKRYYDVPRANLGTGQPGKLELFTVAWLEWHAYSHKPFIVNQPQRVATVPSLGADPSGYDMQVRRSTLPNKRNIDKLGLLAHENMDASSNDVESPFDSVPVVFTVQKKGDRSSGRRKSLAPPEIPVKPDMSLVGSNRASSLGTESLLEDRHRSHSASQLYDKLLPKGDAKPDDDVSAAVSQGSPTDDEKTSPQHEIAMVKVEWALCSGCGSWIPVMECYQCKNCQKYWHNEPHCLRKKGPCSGRSTDETSLCV